MGPNQSARQVYTYLRRDVDALAGARLPTVAADAGEISPRSPAPKMRRGDLGWGSPAPRTRRGDAGWRIRAVDEGGAKRAEGDLPSKRARKAPASPRATGYQYWSGGRLRYKTATLTPALRH